MSSSTTTYHEDRGASRGDEAIIAAGVGTIVALFILSLRMYSRYTTARPGAEDWMVVASFILSVALTATIILEVKHGQGRHIDTVSPENLVKLSQVLFASVPIYNLGLTTTKISILLQYWRVFTGTKIRKPIIIMSIITIAYGLYSVLGNIFMCKPVAFYWNEALDGKCLNKHAIWFSTASINILTDVIIFIMPMPVLKELHLPNRQKWALMGVFALGAFVVLTSILRLKSLYTISVSTDVTWDNGAAAAWSSVELNVGIICASLPTLRKMITKFFPSVFNSAQAYVHYGPTSAAGTRTGTRKSVMKKWPVATATSEWIDHAPLTADSSTGKNYTTIEMLPRGSGGESQEDLVDGKIRVMTVTTQEVRMQAPEAAMTRPQGPGRDKSFSSNEDDIKEV